MSGYVKLAGCYFYLSYDNHESYYIGKIIGEKSDGSILIRKLKSLDSESPGDLAVEILTRESLSDLVFFIFESKNEFKNWWEFMDSPTKPNIFSIVKK